MAGMKGVAMVIQVVNLHKESFDVYIGRGSKWGNPYKIGVDGSRSDVINKYKDYLKKKIRKREITVAQLAALDGSTLGCFCKPKACHGDVLTKAVQWAVKRQKENS